jgi:uncharacterized protein (TIGR02466 family)
MPETVVHNFFPTPVWVVDFEAETHLPLNETLVRTLYAMLGDQPGLAPGAVLQTDTDLHERDEFADLTALIANSVTGVIKFLKLDKTDFLFTGCWANLNPRGGINTPHTHPNNYLSGVYYVQVNDGVDSIFFGDPRPQAIVMSPPVREENIYTGNEVEIEARAGRLVIFPSWLSHGVPANRSAADRISISFNVMFPNYTEEMSPPKWQPTARLKGIPDAGS